MTVLKLPVYRVLQKPLSDQELLKALQAKYPGKKIALAQQLQWFGYMEHDAQGVGMICICKRVPHVEADQRQHFLAVIPNHQVRFANALQGRVQLTSAVVESSI